MRRKTAIPALIAITLLTVLPAAAQDDLPLSEIIGYDDMVSDTLTERAFWDWWHLQAEAGDVLVIDMQAGEALEPLVGILNPEGTLLARSADGAPGGLVTLEYTVTETAEYTIVATRVGNENGTSTGPYDLRVRRANEAAARINPYQQVTFRCRDYEVTNAATITFAEDPEQAAYYHISIYGLDGFRPVIRVELAAVNLTDCSRDTQGMAGNSYTLPGEDPIVLTDPDTYADSAAQLLIASAAPVGDVTLTIGSADGAPGRFIAVIDGFMIGEDDSDFIRIGQGPLASAAPLTLYMIADTGTRLDPAILLVDEEDAVLICDDAGRRGCAGVPSPEGLSIYISESNREISAGPFDAGLVLPPGPPQLREVILSSFRSRTTGPYALVLMGELPPRE